MNAFGQARRTAQKFAPKKVARPVSSQAQHQGRSPGPQERRAVARAQPHWSSGAQHQGRAPGPRERGAVRGAQQAERKALPADLGGGLFGGGAQQNLASRILLGSDAAGELESKFRGALINYLANSSTGRGLEQGQLRSDFEKVKGSLPKGAKPPKIHFIPGLIQKGIGGYVGGDLRKGHVGLDASFARTALPLINSPFAENPARAANLHEIAHLSQPAKMFNNPKGGEGTYTDAGAEAFRVAMSPRLGIRPHAVEGDDYVKQTGQFLRRYGLKGVSGQFKQPAPRGY